MARCNCGKEYWRVTMRGYHRSRFGGERLTVTDTSELVCLKCRDIWRTKAKYVDDILDISDEEVDVFRGKKGKDTDLADSRTITSGINGPHLGKSRTPDLKFREKGSVHGSTGGLVEVTDNITGANLVPLDIQGSLALRNHSPTGFQWGYGGSGPSQLALAILLWATLGNEEVSLSLYQDFKFEVIAQLSGGRPFTLTIREIVEWVNSKQERGE